MIVVKVLDGAVQLEDGRIRNLGHAATLDVVPCARLYLSPVVHHILSHWTLAGGDLEALIPVSTPIHHDLLWWLHHLSLDHGFPLQSLTPLVLMTDASSLGWGAVLGVLTAQGLLSMVEASMSSNWRELKGVWYALQFFAAPLHGHLDVVRVDNRVAVSYINRQFGTRSPTLNLLAHHIVFWAETHLLELQAVHIWGVLNR
ncbi:hypothetical protein NDU88_005571 [Pleurodeles waltl]|uniref:RNase H type-1 domain-containing protein n=1 Tax=Pleurodeles waltl TaxID=8319 RepID=A0AAV7SM10_PLEWA|nr:hypothetical protein NDU88_005571 [Pleurodeles waltl]